MHLRNCLPSLETLAPFPRPLQKRPHSRLILALPWLLPVSQGTGTWTSGPPVWDFWIWKARTTVSPVIEPVLYQTWELSAAVFLHMEETGVHRG